jgi:hypothetical protein
MSGSTLFRRLKELRPSLSVYDLVAPYDFEIELDDNNIISVKKNELYINFDINKAGGFDYSNTIRKIGFFMDQEKAHMTFVTTDSNEGHLYFFELDGKNYVALEVSKIGEESPGGSSFVFLNPEMTTRFVGKMKDHMKDLPRRQAAEKAFKMREHLLSAFVPSVKVEQGAGASASRRGGKRRGGKRRGGKRQRYTRRR